MRKVLSLVLILSLVMGSFGFVFAAPSDGMLSDVAGTDYDEAVTVLYALDVVSGYENTGLYQPEQVVTRAEMAVLIIRELGLASNAEGNTSSFPDMDGYGWAEGYIGYAQQLKIIAGYPDGTFKPGNTVTYDEALTMIVSAIGYTQSAREMQGEWPAVYVAKARQLDITDNVTASGSAGAKRGDIAIYLYNALTCTTGYVDGNGNFKPNTDKDLNEILMINNLGAEQSKNYHVITGDEDALINIKPYVGQSAKTIYMTKGKYEDYVIAIGDVRSEEITGIYDSDEEILTGIDGVEYKLGNVMKDTTSSKATTDPEFFFNGDTAKASDNKVGGVEIVDGTKLGATPEVQLTMHVDKSSRTVNGIYSIMYWKANQTDVVEADDLKDIDDRQKLLGREFAVTDDDEVDELSFQLYGVASLDDIKAGNVVYVYTNKDDEISRVDVGTETVEGEATRVNNTGKKVTISGTVYEFADAKLTNNGVAGEIEPGDIDAGDEVALILDAYGYIYDRDYISSGAENYGVVISAGATTGASKTREIKMVLADGSTKVFEVADKLFDSAKTDFVTGVTNNTNAPNSVNSPVAGYDLNTAGFDAYVGQIVKYSVDKNGKITNFEEFDQSGSVNKNYSHSSNLNYSLRDTDTDKYKVTKSGSYNGYTIADGAVVWTYDGLRTAAGDDDDYSTTTKAKILDSDEAVGQYVVNKNRIVAIVLYEFSTGDDVYGIAVDRSKSSSNEAGYLIDFWIDGSKDTYNATSNPYDDVANWLTPDQFYNKTTNAVNAQGPLWWVKFDAEGDVTGVERAASRTSKVKYTALQINSSTTVEYKSNRVTITGATPVGATNPTEQAKTEFFMPSKASVYYDDKDDYKTGSIKDLADLKDGDVVYFYMTDKDDDEYDVVVVLEK